MSGNGQLGLRPTGDKLTVDDICADLSISRRTFYEWRAGGREAAHRGGNPAASCRRVTLPWPRTLARIWHSGPPTAVPGRTQPHRA